MDTSVTYNLQAYIMLPSLHLLRSVASRLKSLGKFLTLSANMAGTFKMAVDTELAQCETVYRHLENPHLGKLHPLSCTVTS